MGDLHWNPKGRSFYALCRWCGKRITRVASRRPLGFLAAWLMSCPGQPDEHYIMSRPQGGMPAFSPGTRRAARALLQSLPEHTMLVDHEAFPDRATGSGTEPKHMS